MVEAVRAAMGDGAAWGVRLSYVVEEEPLGTAGGVRNAADRVADLVLVLNGDILTDADLSAMLAFHRARGAAASIYLTRVPDPTAYGLVELADGGAIRRFLEKPDPAQVTTDTVNAGAYLLDRSLLDRIPTGRAVSIEREFFPGLLTDRMPFFGWVSGAYWLDIGNPAKYRQGQLDLLAGRVATALAPAGACGDGRFIAERVVVEPGATVTGPAVVGAGCRLAAGAARGPRRRARPRLRGGAGRRRRRRGAVGARGGRRGRRPSRLHCGRGGTHRRASAGRARRGAGAEHGGARGGTPALSRRRGRPHGAVLFFDR